MIGPWRSLASALAWGARGPGFESRRPDQIPHRLTDATNHNGSSLESIWSPNGVQSLWAALGSMATTTVPTVRRFYSTAYRVGQGG